ncbi:MAG: alpha/beta fold hydrolase, partial [Actinomycetota bacterium]
RWGLGEASHLIDLQDIGQLRSIENAENDLWIGAMVTHAEIARHPRVREILPFFAQVAAQIADAQVREVGTIGGSIAHHDPAACWPAAVLAGQAELVTSERQITADDFFLGLFATSLRRDEILLGIRVRHGVRGAYRKHEHPASRFAMPGVALAHMPEGAIRIAVTGLGQGVVRWREAEQALAGRFSQHALQFPGRISRLALLGSTLPMPVSAALLDAAWHNEAKAVAMVNNFSHSSSAQIGGNTVPGLWMMGMNQRLMERQKSGVFGCDMNACNAYARPLTDLSAIRQPTLILAGAQDRMTPPKASRVLASAIATARLEVLAGAGHALMAEQPDQVLNHLRDFLKQ